jgi:hypothetical protein
MVVKGTLMKMIRPFCKRPVSVFGLLWRAGHVESPRGRRERRLAVECKAQTSRAVDR